MIIVILPSLAKAINDEKLLRGQHARPGAEAAAPSRPVAFGAGRSHTSRKSEKSEILNRALRKFGSNERFLRL